MTRAVAWTILVGYATLVLCTGVYFSRRQGDATGFYLGGRRLSTVRVFGSTFSTFLGTGLVFTLGALGYRFGVGAFVLPGVAVAGFLLFAMAAPRFKELSGETDAITLPAVLERYWSARTRALAALVTASLFAGTLAASLLVVGDLVDVFLGVPPPVGIAGFAVLVVGYTVAGGFRAVVWTDMAQMVLILLAIVLLLPLLVIRAGSVSLGELPASHLDPFALPVPVLVAYLFIGVFAFFGSQDLFQRVFAADDARTARRGLLGFAGALAVVGTVAVGLGIVASARLPAVAPDRALLALAESVTPAGLVGVVLVGWLAFANSDADSQLLTVASTVTEDGFESLGVAPARVGDVTAGRLTVAGIGAVAAGVALLAPGLTALFGMLGSWFAILGLVVVATVYWDRTTDIAAFSALAAGFAVPIGFVLATGNFQAAPVVGVVVAGVVVGVGSLLPARDQAL